MRPPRPGLPWSRARAARRGEYAAWMSSAGWWQARRRWRDAWVARFGREPTCAVCGDPWTLRHGDLHHRSYDRLGHERFDDLTPICRRCHQAAHLILESQPAWRRLGRAQATDLIVAHLSRLSAAARSSQAGEGREGR
jgi:5-methylcytosine-specific restriction endonuclease McrA